MVMLFVYDPEHIIRKSQATAGKVDYLGIINLAIGLGLLQIVLDRGQRADWFAATWIWVFTGIAALSLVLLILHELRFPAPILDLSIFSIPPFDISVSLAMVMVIAVYGMNLLNSLFSKTARLFSLEIWTRSFAAWLWQLDWNVADRAAIAPWLRQPKPGWIRITRLRALVNESMDPRRRHRFRSPRHDPVRARYGLIFPVVVLPHPMFKRIAAISGTICARLAYFR
jgi:hypothetical protein